MNKQLKTYQATEIHSLIITVREQKVILDADLAKLYGVETKRINEALKRNIDRFPEDFAFRLTKDEVVSLKSQFAASSFESDRSQFATGSTHGGRRKLPRAFTEHGAIMAATVLLAALALGALVAAGDTAETV